MLASLAFADAGRSQYEAAALRALDNGGNILALSDLHLTVDSNGQLEGMPQQRLEAIKSWLRQNPGKVTQIVWMGDIIDAGKGPRELSAKLALMERVIREVSEAADLPTVGTRNSEQANHVFVMGNHDIVVDMPRFKKAKEIFERDIVPTIKKGPDGKPDRAEYLRLRPVPDDYIDVERTAEVVEMWKRLGYVATTDSREAKEVVLKGFGDARFGRRRGFILEHVPRSLGGEKQTRTAVVPEGQSKLAGTVEEILISDTAIGRMSGDLHDPRSLESPPLQKEKGKLVPSRRIEDEGLVFRSIDAGSVGSPIVTSVKGADGERVQLPNTVVLINPKEGGTAYHYEVGEEGVRPYQLPSAKRTTAVPTRTFHDSGLPLLHPQLEQVNGIYRDSAPLSFRCDDSYAAATH